MQFRILGEVQVQEDDGTDVVLGGRKPRAVLAVLLLNANKAVQTDRLAQALWGEDASADSVRTVQVHVSRLRKALGGGTRLTSTRSGYQLRVEPGELDLVRFDQLVEEAHDALAAGHPERAASVLRDADALWRGPPLADLAFEPFAPEAIARLEERRLLALEVRLDAELAAGRHADVVADLRELVAEYPAREHLAAQLMLALYRCGRQSDALDAFQAARRRLSEGLGVEPGAELRAMQAAVLKQDPGLDLPAGTELPRVLEDATAAPLVGRDADLQALRSCWMAARGDSGALVVLAGETGIGKTRLAAELASEVLRAGATVIYAPGDRPPATAFVQALAAARTAARPLLVVADDADRLSPTVLDGVREAVGPSVLVLVTATDQQALVALGTPDALVPLTGLGSDGVGAIISLYQPESRGEAVPVERLLVETRGVPSRVHEEANRWARLGAAERVGAVAERRSELRSMEAELTDRVAQLQRVGDWAPRDGGDGDGVVCPFKGLASFDADDAPYFFGRDRLIARLVAGLAGAPLLGIVGPSGSGKSSVLRAGLLPRLAAGVLPRSEQWSQVVMRPGAHPRRELQAALRRAASGRLVLAVDQFEETFTVCRDDTERSAFIAELVHACEREPPTVVVVALRADFYGSCAEYPALARLLAANNVLVRPMRHDELRQAVTRPAERAGLEVEPDLADAIVRDVEGRPGALPLMSTALLELWQRRDGRRLRLATYEETGGVKGAVGRHAEDAYSRLGERQQAVARRVLLRLAEVEPEGGVERRRLPIGDLEDGTGAVVDVIDELAAARLLTMSEGTVEFAHEALMREWPRLRDWIDDNRDDLKVHRSLKVASDEWARLGQEEGALYRGARLVEASEWAERADPGPTEQESRFLTASIDRERRERRGHRRRIAIAFGSLSVGIVVIAIVALVAIGERRDAEDARNVATSRALALQSSNTLDADPSLALTLALSAVHANRTEQAIGALRQATLAVRQIAVLRADPLTAWTVASSSDGSHLVTGGDAGTAIVWDAAKRAGTARWAAHHGPVLTARYAPDDRHIALGFDDGTVAVTDGSLRNPVVVLSAGSAVHRVAYSGHGDRIAAALDDGTVKVFAADGSGQAVTLKGHDGPVLGVDFSADGGRVVTAGHDGSVRLWDAADGSELRQLLPPGGLDETDVRFSPDGSRLLCVGFDRQIRFWDTDTWKPEKPFSGGGRALLAAAFSRDGERFAASGKDGVVRVWSAVGGSPVAVLRGQGGRVYDIAFGARSDRVASAGDDGNAWVWDAGRTEVWRTEGDTNQINFSPDGRSLSGGANDGNARIWDADTGRVLARLPGSEDYTTARYSPTSDEVVVGSAAAGTVRIWPGTGGTPRTIAKLPTKRQVYAARFDRAGNRVVYVDDQGTVVLHDLHSGNSVTLRGAKKQLYDVQASPDGKHVAGAGETGKVFVWRIDHPEAPELALAGNKAHVNSLAYSADGRIVSAGADRTVHVWSPDGKLVATLRGHDDEVSTAIFTNDGRQILSSSNDGTLRLWNAKGGDALLVLQSGTKELYDVTQSADGRIATLDADGVVRVFACEVCGSVDELETLARSRVARPLTPAERQRFLSTG